MCRLAHRLDHEPIYSEGQMTRKKLHWIEYVIFTIVIVVVVLIYCTHMGASQ